MHVMCACVCIPSSTYGCQNCEKKFIRNCTVIHNHRGVMYRQSHIYRYHNMYVIDHMYKYIDVMIYI